ncbi:hypothetical protein ABK905_03310 [Acerihabitans sp. KWT182]|uniref:Lactonase family protein n=1 Tax=Acerihabitans sp. KWT182 TaxID=3157919 RepID=A0AAU7QBM9_9GAMM
MGTSLFRYSRACLLLAAALGGSAQAATFAYISNADSGDITVYRLDEQSGALTKTATQPVGGEPLCRWRFRRISIIFMRRCVPSPTRF